MIENFLVEHVQNGCGQSGLLTLRWRMNNKESEVSEEWTDGINEFLHDGTNLCKLKLLENFWDEHDQKWVWPVWSWDSKIYCIQK